MVLIQKRVNYSYINIIILISIFFVYLSIPESAFSNSMKTTAWIHAETKKPFLNTAIQSHRNDNTSGLRFKKKFNSVKFKFAISANNKNKLAFDQSFIEFESKNKTFGVGKIDRNWSFSPNTSLILSNNARPANSIYFVYNNDQRLNNFLTSWAGPISLEVFNSTPSTTIKVKNSMLFGMRAVIEPVQNLKLELLKVSQWGGDGQSENLSSFLASIIGNTNEDQHSNINQLAGYGISYLTNLIETPVRFYAQLIGEDEAGSLPSCLMSLIGSELQFPTNKLISHLGIEFIDTRISTSTHGYCGTNTAYNNGVYSYTNYGNTMGTGIDTEGTSLEFFGRSQVSEKIHIEYSTKAVVINDVNWSDHRISSKRQSGFISSIGTSWNKNNLNLNGNIFYQDFNLNKANIMSGLGISISSSIMF